MIPAIRRERRGTRWCPGLAETTAFPNQISGDGERAWLRPEDGEQLRKTPEIDLGSTRMCTYVHMHLHTMNIYTQYGKKKRGIH